MLANAGVMPARPLGRSMRAWGVAAALLALISAVLLGIRVWKEGPRELKLFAAENAWLAGAPAAALGTLDGLIERNPEDAAALGMRGRARLDLAVRVEGFDRQRGLSFLASRDLLAAARLRPPSAYDEVALAMALGRIGETEEAAEAAGRGIALFPTWHGGYEMLGLALETQGRVDEALAVYALGAAQPSARELRMRLDAFRRQR